MKKFFLIFILFLSHFVFGQNIQPRPNPPRAVNDFGNMLESFQAEALERKVRAYNDSTSSAIVIVTVADLADYGVEEVALKYLRDWGVGTKEKNNGVVILVSKNQRKVGIQTGYGMEGVLPDITAKHIIEERMIPFFKANDNYRALDNGVDAIILAAAGEYKANPQNKSTRGVSLQSIIFIIILIIFLLSRMGGGGGRGNYMSRRGSRTLEGGLPWFILGNILGSGGSRGGWGDGGGGGFGGGGGGGFGGFGGGSGGGGGASGGW